MLRRLVDDSGESSGRRARLGRSPETIAVIGAPEIGDADDSVELLLLMPLLLVVEIGAENNLILVMVMSLMLGGESWLVVWAKLLRLPLFPPQLPVGGQSLLVDYFLVAYFVCFGQYSSKIDAA